MGNETSSYQSQRYGDLRDKEISMLQSNSDLSEGEIRKYYETFKQECPSGRMNRSQFNKFSGHLLGGVTNQEFLDNVFTVCDKNGDGTIDFSEFALAVSTLANNKNIDAQLDFVFELIDKTGDGRISYDEMAYFLQQMSKARGSGGVSNYQAKDSATDLFRASGVDTNQKISKRDFVNVCKTNPDVKRLFGH